jgi:hypothetical protein
MAGALVPSARGGSGLFDGFFLITIVNFPTRLKLDRARVVCAISKRQCEHLGAVAYDSVRRRPLEEFWISTASGNFYRAQPNRLHLRFSHSHSRPRVLAQSRRYRLCPRLLPKVHSMPPSSRWMLVMRCPMHLSRTGCRAGPAGFGQIRCSQRSPELGGSQAPRPTPG